MHIIKKSPRNTHTERLIERQTDRRADGRTDKLTYTEGRKTTADINGKSSNVNIRENSDISTHEHSWSHGWMAG